MQMDKTHRLIVQQLLVAVPVQLLEPRRAMEAAAVAAIIIMVEAMEDQ